MGRALRCDIKLAYRTKPVITVQMEVAAVEGGMRKETDHVPAKPLDHVGLSGPSTVPCVAIRWQIAQKLQGCTEVLPHRENDRFRDLFDLQLLAGLVTDDGWPGVHSACVEVFAGRAKHSWPPDVTVYESWELGYRALAEETGFSVLDIAEAADSDRAIGGRPWAQTPATPDRPPNGRRRSTRSPPVGRTMGRHRHYCRARVHRTLDGFTEASAAPPLPGAHRYRGML